MEEVRGVIKSAKRWIRELNRAKLWRLLGAYVVAVKYELVVDVSDPELKTYVHGHAIFAVPKGATPALAQQLARDATSITHMHFGRVKTWNEKKIGYILKHPLKLRWTDGAGYLSKLEVVAKLNSAQAVRIHRATQRLDYLSFTRSKRSLSLCTDIARIPIHSVRPALKKVIPSGHVADQLLEVEMQRRYAEGVIKRTKIYPLPVEEIRSAFRLAMEGILEGYSDLHPLGDPSRLVYLNTLAPRPRHRWRDGTSKRVWRADLRRIRAMRRRVDAVELMI